MFIAAMRSVCATMAQRERASHEHPGSKPDLGQRDEPEDHRSVLVTADDPRHDPAVARDRVERFEQKSEEQPDEGYIASSSTM